MIGSGSHFKYAVGIHVPKETAGIESPRSPSVHSDRDEQRQSSSRKQLPLVYSRKVHIRYVTIRAMTEVFLSRWQNRANNRRHSNRIEDFINIVDPNRPIPKHVSEYLTLPLLIVTFELNAASISTS